MLLFWADKDNAAKSPLFTDLPTLFGLLINKVLRKVSVDVVKRILHDIKRATIILLEG